MGRAVVVGGEATLKKKSTRKQSSKMGTRDDEYDYLFKGNVLSEGGRVTAGSSSPSKLRRRRLEVRKSGEPAGMLKLALPASSEGGHRANPEITFRNKRRGLCVCCWCCCCPCCPPRRPQSRRPPAGGAVGEGQRRAGQRRG